VASDSDTFSPRRFARRELIVAAAQQIILRDGPAACTTREIARESGLNKGLIYYYFESHEEIIDAAMRAFTAELTTAIVRARAEHADPAERFWALVEDYLAVFDARPGLALAFYEYWMRCTREGRMDNITRVQREIIGRFAELLADGGADDAPLRARVVVSYIVGVLVRTLAAPQSFDELRPEIMILAGLAIPRGSGRGAAGSADPPGA
jgi:AcrR family transcriptional regulator